MFRTNPRPIRAPWRTLAVATVMLGLAACGGEASARDAAIDRMVEQGMGREFAECLINSVADELGDEAVAEDYEATSDETTQIFELTDACLIRD